MRTLQQKLDSMNMKDTVIMLYSGRYCDTQFHLDFEFTGKDSGFKFTTEKYSTLEEVVDDAYAKFTAITDKVFKEAIPPQLTYEQGSDKVVEEPVTPPSRNLDDEVPF